MAAERGLKHLEEQKVSLEPKWLFSMKHNEIHYRQRTSNHIIKPSPEHGTFQLRRPNPAASESGDDRGHLSKNLERGKSRRGLRKCNVEIDTILGATDRHVSDSRLESNQENAAPPPLKHQGCTTPNS